MMNKEKIKVRLALIGLIGLWLLIGITLLPWSELDFKSSQLAQVPGIEAKENNDPFADLELTAEAVAVFDIINDEFIYTQNSQESLPIASITKMITALTAQRLLNPETIITIDREALRIDDISGGLSQGSSWEAKDLISLDEGAHSSLSF